MPCSACEPPYCYTIPKDNECYDGYFIVEPNFALLYKSDYNLTIRVTNKAMLVSVLAMQVKIILL